MGPIRVGQGTGGHRLGEGANEFGIKSAFRGVFEENLQTLCWRCNRTKSNKIVSV